MCTWAAKVVRFRRVYVDAEHGVPFLSSSDIISMRPEITNYLSKKLMRRLDEQIVQKWDLLISRSGTVGNVALAGLTHAGKALSEDAIRLRAGTTDAAGYASAFLRCRYGRPQLTGASYGSVVVHIEPSHLQRVLIPRLHPLRLAKIGGRMREACELRDQANALIDEADRLLHARLKLRPLREIPRPRRIYQVVHAAHLQGRLEASFHDPVAEVAIKLLKDSGAEVTTMADPRVTAEIRPITKFRKRVYVPHGGIPLLGGKQLFQVDPIDVKGLAKGAHTKDLPEIALVEQMVLVTCSGTVGRVQIVPAYMKGWTANQHATRFIAAADMNPGYVYAWLASDYGTKLTTRHAYGSVILEVDKQMFGSVPIPLADAATRKEIGDLVLKANDCRDTAWQKEREAIAQIEAIVAGDASKQ
jgi:type I restriction enzyme S subunit